jgi:hypothetical protein
MIQQIFHSEKIHASSNSSATHDVVSIKNGKGYKLREILTPKGKVAKRTRKNLKPTEIRHIMNGQFLPGLWQGCGNASGKKSRRTSRR